MINDYLDRGFKLALLSRSKVLDFRGMKYEVQYDDSELIAYFDSPKLQESEIRKLCVYINQKLEFGHFSNKQTRITFQETVFDNVSNESQPLFFTINAINKFLKVIEKYILAFDSNHLNNFERESKSLKEVCLSASNLSKSLRPIFCSKITYDNVKIFTQDIELIEAIIQIDERLIRKHFGKGIEIDVSGSINFLAPRHFDSLKQSLSSFLSISLEQLNQINNFIEVLKQNNIYIKDLDVFKKSIYFIEQNFYIIPKKYISDFITLDPNKKTPSYLINPKDYLGENKQITFTDQRIFEGFESIREIEILDYEAYKLMFNEVNKAQKDDNFICFFGLKKKSKNYFAVFEKFEIEAFGNSFIDEQNSSRLNLLSKCLLKIIETMTKDFTHNVKYYYTIRISNLSFVDNNLKIVPSITGPKDFSEVSPEELFAIVAYYNKPYFIVLNLLFHFNDFSKILGKAFKYEFKTLNEGETIMKKIKKLTKKDQFYFNVCDIYAFYLEVIERIVEKLLEYLNLSNYDLISQNFYKECLMVKKIIIRSKVLSKSSTILTDIIKKTEPDPGSGLISRQANIRTEYLHGSTVPLSQRPGFDVENFSAEFIQKFNLISEIEEESKSPAWKFPKSFKPNLEKFEEVAENAKKRYWRDFSEAKNFCENLLNIKVKLLCEKEEITESSSNVFIFGRVLYRMLFEEKNKKINIKFQSISNNFSKYLKTVLTKRVFYNFEKSDQIKLSKYCNLCRMTMNYTISQRPSFKQIKEILWK